MVGGFLFGFGPLIARLNPAGLSLVIWLPRFAFFFAAPGSACGFACLLWFWWPPIVPCLCFWLVGGGGLVYINPVGS